MILRKVLGAVALTFVFSTASADLTPWEDYEESEAVWTVTTIKVAANMGDAYLEGLKNTWVAGNEVALKLGQIEDYKIYRSDLPESGVIGVSPLVFGYSASATSQNVGSRSITCPT